MMKKLLMAAAIVVLTGAAAQAADWRDGLYVKGGAGWNHTQDLEYDTPGTSVDAELDEGYGLSGAVGMDYGELRSELELSYRDNDLDGAAVNGAPVGSVGGDINSTALMLNGYYDIPTGTPITPYIGAGIGAAHVNANDISAGGAAVADGDDTVFAYQAMAGAEYPMSANTALFTEYKYFGTDDVSIDTAAGSATDLNYDNHSIMLGARYSFN